MEETTERPSRVVGANILPQAKDLDELADMLEEIAGQLRHGFTRGYYPHWSVSSQEVCT